MSDDLFLVRPVCITLLLLVACGGGGTPGGGTPDSGVPGLVDISTDLGPIGSRYGLPALAAAASDGTAVLGSGVTGVRKVGDATLATLQDHWHLGSETKAMTATLTALFVEAGALSWDTTIPDAFPEWATSINPGYRTVTLKKLLGHLGGAPGNLPADVSAVMNGSGTSQDLRRQAVQMMLTRAPGASVGTYTYSNAGYMMVGAALERRSNASWEDLMKQRIFGPLQMSGCGFGPPATPGVTDQPWGHSVGAGGALVPTRGDNPPSLGPAGTVNCPLTDWLRFLREHLHGARHEPTVLALSAANWTTLQTPLGSDGYALGWIVASQTWAGGTVLTHDGTNTYNYAIVWIAPSVNRIFVGVTNRGDTQAPTAINDAIVYLVGKFPGR